MAEINVEKFLIHYWKKLELVSDPSDFLCSKCGDLAVRHCISHCGHIFCHLCRKDFYINHKFTCPKCNQALDSLVNKSASIHNNLYELNAKCLYKGYGCKACLPLAQLANHVTRCLFRTKEKHPEDCFRYFESFETAQTNTSMLVTPEGSPIMNPNAFPITLPKGLSIMTPDVSPIMSMNVSPIMTPNMSPIKLPQVYAMMTPDHSPIMSPKSFPMSPNASPIMPSEVSPIWHPEESPIWHLEESLMQFSSAYSDTFDNTQFQLSASTDGFLKEKSWNEEVFKIIHSQLKLYSERLPEIKADLYLIDQAEPSDDKEQINSTDVDNPLIEGEKHTEEVVVDYAYVINVIDRITEACIGNLVFLGELFNQKKDVKIINERLVNEINALLENHANNGEALELMISLANLASDTLELTRQRIKQFKKLLNFLMENAAKLSLYLKSSLQGYTCEFKCTLEKLVNTGGIIRENIYLTGIMKVMLLQYEGLRVNYQNSNFTKSQICNIIGRLVKMGVI